MIRALDPTVLLSGLTTVPAQVGSRLWLEGLIFVALAGVVLFAVCRSSNRS